MLTIPQDIPDFVLSSQLDNFTISADKRVTFVLKQANTVILQETYTQDANNQIHILDLFSLMEPYLIGSPMLQFSYEVSASSETTISKTFTVLLCRPIIPCSGVDFVTNYFLTPLAGRDKITSFNRTETLYLTTGSLSSGGTTIPVTAECVFVNDQNQLLKSTRSLGNVADYGIRSIDVSPSRFTQSGYRLLRYTILAGARKQTFHVDQDEPESVGLPELVRMRRDILLCGRRYGRAGTDPECSLLRRAIQELLRRRAAQAHTQYRLHPRRYVQPGRRCGKSYRNLADG